MPSSRRAKDPKSAGTLFITAQESRFHADIDEDNNLKEIVVKDLSISIGNRELLSRANFQLQRGRKYVLHGRNGVGKSTLLRAIASDQIPSIRRGVKVLLLGQTISEVDEDGEGSAEGRSVIEYVVRSDTERETLMHEAKVLSAGIEDSGDPIAGVRALRQVEFERVERKLEGVKQIAERRSGGRGADAKKVLLKTEKEVEIARERLEGEIGAEEMGEESKRAAEILGEIQTSLELMDAAAAEARARSILLGLGFSEESLSQPRSQLSGGWRTRCSLACALCQSPDLLCLDEPTNFLDLPSIIWLERYILEQTPNTTVLVVTHDRSFGDSIADELLILRNQTLERFKGNLSSYETARLKTYRHLTRLKDAQEKQKKHIQSTIDGNVAAAKRAGDDKKLKQAASRKKKLDERMGMQTSAKGTRFKLNRDRAGYYADGLRNEIEVPTFDPPAQMVIPAEPVDLRFPGSLVSFEKVNFSYTVAGKKTPILQDIDLTIQMGDRIGIAGLNGSGKSTLVALAMGAASGMEGKVMLPTTGTVARHTRAKFALYSQQTAEEVEELAAKRPDLTALSHVMEYLGPEVSEQEARGLLSGVGLTGKVASDVPIALLSGGQRVRLALAKILWSPPHLLILDEVTTHLDTDTIQALITALKTYEGAILVVTHDRFFMRCVVEGVSMKEMAAISRPEDDGSEESESSEDEDEAAARTRVVYRLSKGKLIKLERGMEQYEEIAARSATKLGKA